MSGPGPQRTCVGCRVTTAATELVRVTRTADGDLVVGRSLPGRGAWLHPDTACLDAAVKRRGFARALRGPVRDGAAEAVRTAIATDPQVASGP